MAFDIAAYQRLVSEARREYPEWRAGQAYFNVLARFRPDLARTVRGSGLDPFHHDERIPALLGMLAATNG